MNQQIVKVENPTRSDTLGLPGTQLEDALLKLAEQTAQVAKLVTEARIERAQRVYERHTNGPIVPAPLEGEQINAVADAINQASLILQGVPRMPAHEVMPLRRVNPDGGETQGEVASLSGSELIISTEPKKAIVRSAISQVRKARWGTAGNSDRGELEIMNEYLSEVNKATTPDPQTLTTLGDFSPHLVNSLIQRCGGVDKAAEAIAIYQTATSITAPEERNKGFLATRGWSGFDLHPGQYLPVEAFPGTLRRYMNGDVNPRLLKRAVNKPDVEVSVEDMLTNPGGYCRAGGGSTEHRSGMTMDGLPITLTLYEGQPVSVKFSVPGIGEVGRLFKPGLLQELGRQLYVGGQVIRDTSSRLLGISSGKPNIVIGEK